MVVLSGCAVSSHAQAKQPANYALQMANVRAQMMADARQQKILEDTDRLLQLAQQLKQSVDQARKDELSIDVIRKAEQIEKLARSIKEHMKQ